MTNPNRKIIHIKGNYINDSTDVIADITALCRKHKVSIDDINMATFGQKSYYAMISSRCFPTNTHIFWNELFDITGNHDIELSLMSKEETQDGSGSN